MRQLDDCCVLARNGIFPHLADLNWGSVWNSLRIGMRHDSNRSVEGQCYYGPMLIPNFSAVCPAPLPSYAPDVIAGAFAPVRLTPWKIKALKIAAPIELRTRADFKHLGLDPRR
jgi:hypothetical protein